MPDETAAQPVCWTAGLPALAALSEESALPALSIGREGGIFNYHKLGAQTDQKLCAAYDGNLHLLNTRVVKNTFASCGRSAQTSSIHSLGSNLDSGTSCEFNTLLGDQVETDPLLGPLQDNGGITQTQALPAGSPAIDAGQNDGCPVADQRGVTALRALTGSTSP